MEALGGADQAALSEGTQGAPSEGIERMLRVYFLLQWYGLADEALEDAIYDSQAMRLLVGIDLSQEGIPDATTLRNVPTLTGASRSDAGYFCRG